MDFICTRQCNPEPAEKPKGTGMFAPEAILRRWVSAVDHARKRHPIIVTVVTRKARSQSFSAPSTGDSDRG